MAPSGGIWPFLSFCNRNVKISDQERQLSKKSINSISITGWFIKRGINYGPLVNTTLCLSTTYIHIYISTFYKKVCRSNQSINIDTEFSLTSSKLGSMNRNTWSLPNLTVMPFCSVVVSEIRWLLTWVSDSGLLGVTVTTPSFSTRPSTQWHGWMFGPWIWNINQWWSLYFLHLTLLLVLRFNIFRSLEDHFHKVIQKKNF